jgi:Na+-transporting NADH:ubiquinone oxidoreductase subunit C
MVGISVTFGIALAAVHHATTEILAQNERFYKNRVLSRAFMLEVEEDAPSAYEDAIDRYLTKSHVTYAGRTWEVFKTKSPMEQRSGFIFIATGFWGPIIGVAVVSEDFSTIQNIQFLEHEETPGLGGRIEEPWFTDQFKGLKIAWDQPPGQRIVIGPSTDATVNNRVDAITGASQTSMALMKSLNAELALYREALSGKDAG